MTDGCDSCPVAKLLRDRVRYLDEILDQSPAMVRRLSPDTTIEYVNDAAANALGGDKDTVIGRKLIDFLPSSERDQILENMKNTERGEPYDVRLADGRIESWRNFTITDDEGNVVSFITMGEDVTKTRAVEERDAAALLISNRALRQALEAAEMADKAKTTFLAEMSHDLRTPLNAIIGFAQLMESGEVTKAQSQEYAGAIVESGGALLDLVQRVLDLSSAESADNALTHFEDVDLTSILKRLMRQAQPILRPGVSLRQQFGDDPIPVRGDPIMLTRALMNLVSNSAKFTTQGWIGVEARIRGEIVQIFVKDTGPGVEPKEIERILRPFEHGDPERNARTRSDSDHGHGLGLPIARRYIENHEGQLQFRSKPGVGSVVEIRLPVRPQ